MEHLQRRPVDERPVVTVANDGQVVRVTGDFFEEARDLLRGRKDSDAVREYWKICSYLELTSARLTGVVPPKQSSTILCVGRLDEDGFDENQVRYGETLLHANRPAEAVLRKGVALFRSARDSASMTIPVRTSADAR